MTMSDTLEHISAVKSGLPVLQPWELATLPILPESSVPSDLEHVSNDEFYAWVIWNGIPLTGPIEWNFDNRCAVVNHCIQAGMRLRIPGELPTELVIFSQLFEVVKPASEGS